MISAVFVSYRSGEAAVRAIESLRRSAGAPCEAIVVVNSGDEVEVAQVRGAADRVVVAHRNLGFAGGLNAGFDAAKGDVLLLANPDLHFVGDAAERLASRVSRTGDFVACGPAFFLDDAATLLIPPAEEPHPLAKARQRAPGLAPFRREVLRVLRLWGAVSRAEAVPARALSGALVAVNRATLRAVGPFDEGYPLYFEENDWQRRLRALGGHLVQATDARVVHHFNQSAKTEPKAAGWFAQSERRFLASHFGQRGLRALEAPSPPAAPHPEGPLRFAAAVDAGIALSPRPDFRPFAYTPLRDGANTWEPPADVAARMSGPWYARVFDRASGASLGEGAIE